MAAFRFALQASGAASPAAWRDLARKTEDLGYSTLYVPDHLGDQWAPMIALTVAAEATTSLRVGTLVLDNDFRHPLVLAKEAATLDMVTGGRFELGMGAGWMTTDYLQSGIPMERPAVRVARLAESLEIMRALWRDGSVTFTGEYYRVSEAVSSPAPVTPGGPPLGDGLHHDRDGGDSRRRATADARVERRRLSVASRRVALDGGCHAHSPARFANGEPHLQRRCAAATIEFADVCQANEPIAMDARQRGRAGCLNRSE